MLKQAHEVFSSLGLKKWANAILTLPQQIEISVIFYGNSYSHSFTPIRATKLNRNLITNSGII